MIEASERPLLLIGAGANRKNTSQALSEFVDKTGIPFFNTQMGKGVIDERSPKYMGTAALSDSDFLHCAIDKADLIINIGHDVIEKPPFFMHHGGTKVIHINYSAAGVDPVYFPQLNVVGDINTSVKFIADRLSPNKKWDFTEFESIQVEVEKHLSKYAADDRFPMLPQRVVQILREEMPDDGIIALDNGMYKLWFARNYKAYQRNTLLLDNALASMGAGLPAAMLAKLINPDKRVVAVCGDGGFMMNSQEMETAVRLRLNITIIIINDSGYGMIKWKQDGLELEDYGLNFTNPDFVKYAESYGAKGHRPKSDVEFQKILAHCDQNEGVHLIDLAIDYSLNHSILNVLLKENTCSL